MKPSGELFFRWFDREKSGSSSADFVGGCEWLAQSPSKYTGVVLLVRIQECFKEFLLQVKPDVFSASP